MERSDPLRSRRNVIVNTYPAIKISIHMRSKIFCITSVVLKVLHSRKEPSTSAFVALLCSGSNDDFFAGVSLESPDEIY